MKLKMKHLNFTRFLFDYAHRVSKEWSNICYADGDISNCWGQSYDKHQICRAATPACRHGLKLKALWSMCLWFLCYSNILFSVCRKNFTILFSCSTHRWAVFCQNCTRVIHSLSGSSLQCILDKDFNAVIKCLDMIANDELQPKDIRHKTSSLQGKLDFLETAFVVTSWGSILKTFNKVSKELLSNYRSRTSNITVPIQNIKFTRRFWLFKKFKKGKI